MIQATDANNARGIEESPLAWLVGRMRAIADEYDRESRRLLSGAVAGMLREWADEAHAMSDNRTADVPPYVHDLLDALLGGAPLDFKDHDVPKGVRRRIAYVVATRADNARPATRGWAAVRAEHQRIVAEARDESEREEIQRAGAGDDEPTVRLDVPTAPAERPAGGLAPPGEGDRVASTAQRRPEGADWPYAKPAAKPAAEGGPA